MSANAVGVLDAVVALFALFSLIVSMLLINSNEGDYWRHLEDRPPHRLDYRLPSIIIIINNKKNKKKKKRKKNNIIIYSKIEILYSFSFFLFFFLILY
jgi:hypothetical protein